MPFNSLISLSLSKNRLKKNFTLFALVNISQLYVSILSMDLSSSSHVMGGTISIVGNSMISAPSSSNNSNSSECFLVTRILCPNKGFFSYHLRCSLSFTTSPTTITAGGLISFSLTKSGMFLKLPTIVVWSGRVPHRITATGVSGFLLFSISR